MAITVNRAVCCVVACWSVLVAPVLGQQLEGEPPPAGEASPAPYLPADPMDFRTVLGPPPAVDSAWDKVDRRVDEEFQVVADTRRQSAELDALLVYPRFAEAFGKPIDRKSSPALLTLLNRALRDVSLTTFAAKDHFQRPRPFQRFQLSHMCGQQSPPKPELHPTHGSSYPSGHSAYGWAVAMILTRVAPERAEALMTRAAEYAESRLICGMHFPSDVQAGRVIAAAVVGHLDSSSEFLSDLARARSERHRDMIHE
jgi:acid phosphatase (class A)